MKLKQNVSKTFSLMSNLKIAPTFTLSIVCLCDKCWDFGRFINAVFSDAFHLFFPFHFFKKLGSRILDVVVLKIYLFYQRVFSLQ